MYFTQFSVTACSRVLNQIMSLLNGWLLTAHACVLHNGAINVEELI
jgi:hypothetical protein